jgi:diacylglycerol kinase family enzyme
MVETNVSAPAGIAQRWLARLAFASALAALVTLVAGGARSIAAAAVGIVGLAATLAGVWWFLSNRGVIRWAAASIAVMAPIIAVTVYITSGLLWPILLIIVFMVVAFVAARAALSQAVSAPTMNERSTPPPTRPFVIMNPRSGGGKVVKFDLATEARALGAEVALLDGPGPVDVAALARDAVADGADLLGVAGGDGTQALVAGIAADHNVPFLVIAAGTRNHFAMDLGLDRDHPQSGFDALTDGMEITMDLGAIGGRTFVNNASFGAYAQIVQSPAYRADKRATTLKMLPDLLSGRRGPRLVARIDDAVAIEGPSAILISNNRYELGDAAGLGRRVHLDRGVLGVIAITVSSAAQAAALLRKSDSSGLRTFTAREVVIDADADEIPVGIDGESVMMTTPVRCEIRPRALRVRVPRERPGLPRPTPGRHLGLLRHLALTTGRVSGEGGTQRPPT